MRLCSLQPTPVWLFALQAIAIQLGRDRGTIRFAQSSDGPGPGWLKGRFDAQVTEPALGEHLLFETSWFFVSRIPKHQRGFSP
jgi:hypothetical protein